MTDIISTNTDSDISVRRKIAFLLNALLIPASPDADTPPPRPHPVAGENSVTLHPTDSNVPDTNAPVHPNSHASMVADPASFSTTELTRAALAQRGLLQKLLPPLRWLTARAFMRFVEGVYASFFLGSAAARLPSSAKAPHGQRCPFGF